MSVESVLARVAELDAALHPPATNAPASVPGAGAADFQGALQGAIASNAARGSYPHLSGDLDGNPELLQRLEALAARRSEDFHVTSGHRTLEEQQRLWDGRHANPYPVARPGTSRHESGNAADVTIGGRAIQDVIPYAELVAAGLAPLRGDAVHVELG